MRLFSYNAKVYAPFALRDFSHSGNGGKRPRIPAFGAGAAELSYNLANEAKNRAAVLQYETLLPPVCSFRQKRRIGRNFSDWRHNML
jgi:hypothetical protein